jgi:hypothetical protein
MAMKIIPKKISATEFAFIIEVNGEIKDVRIGYERLDDLLQKRVKDIDEA